MQIQNFLKKAALVLVIAFAAISSQAQVDHVQTGTTSVALSPEFASALQAIGVTAGALNPAQLQNGVATFPIVGGAIELQTARSVIYHSGGLVLSTQSNQVQLEGFVIDTTGTPAILTGLVIANNKLVGRATLFDLQLPSGVTLPLKPDSNGVLNFQGVQLKLSSDAASALNSAFNVNAFQAGAVLGTANVVVLVGP